MLLYLTINTEQKKLRIESFDSLMLIFFLILKEEAEKCCHLLYRIAKNEKISSTLLQMLYLSKAPLYF